MTLNGMSMAYDVAREFSGSEAEALAAFMGRAVSGRSARGYGGGRRVAAGLTAVGGAGGRVEGGEMEVIGTAASGRRAGVRSAEGLPGWRWARRPSFSRLPAWQDARRRSFSGEGKRQAARRRSSASGMHGQRVEIRRFSGLPGWQGARRRSVSLRAAGRFSRWPGGKRPIRDEPGRCLLG